MLLIWEWKLLHLLILLPFTCWSINHWTLINFITLLIYVWPFVNWRQLMNILFKWLRMRYYMLLHYTWIPSLYLLIIGLLLFWLMLILFPCVLYKYYPLWIWNYFGACCVWSLAWILWLWSWKYLFLLFFDLC
jgi:hypothetical protein